MYLMARAVVPRPKSPPASPDPCGRHRLQLAVDALHREIGFLEGEINSIEGVHAASRCCREVDEFVGRNADPFITISSDKRNSVQSHHFLKKFRARTCLSYLSSICCCGGCSSSSSGQLKRLSCACCSCGALQRLSRCRRRRSRCRLGCASCRRRRCSVKCPRCSCDDCACRCRCPTCSSFACPGCSAAACCTCTPRCCLCS